MPIRQSLDFLQQYARAHPKSDIAALLPYIYTSVVEFGAREALEFGVREGESSRALLLAMKKTGGRLVSVDLGEELDTTWHEQLGGEENGPWEVIIGDSQSVDLPDRPYDFAFVDSGHTYECTWNELERLNKLIAGPKGMIMLHDWVPAKPTFNVKGAVMDFLRQHRHWKLTDIQVRSNGLATLRKE
jgi:predicted O-methyltransferase YrrM